MGKKQGKMDRTSAAITESVLHAVDLLKKGETWGVLALLAAFVVIIYFGSKFALKTDNLLHYIHYSGAACREPGDAAIFFLFCGALFFALSTVAMFGEITLYLRLRVTAAHFQTRQAFVGAIGWGSFAVALGVGETVYLSSLCF